jgi:hypothetical protein
MNDKRTYMHIDDKQEKQMQMLSKRSTILLTHPNKFADIKIGVTLRPICEGISFHGGAENIADVKASCLEGMAPRL